ncbi:MAG: MFS transporter, partial [Dehalococcoidia bacterium]
WAPVFIILLLGRFLYGVISIAREPARVLLIRQWILPNEIVIANALANFLWGIVGVGFVLTPVILRLLDNSWRNTLYVFGVVSLVLAVVWQIFGKERITPEYEAQLRSQDTSPIGSIFRHRELWLLGLGMMGIGINFSAFSTFWPSFRLDEYGMSLTASAIVMGVGGLFSSVTGIVVGILVARKGRKRQVLLMSGVVIALTSVALLWTGSYSLLLLIFVVQSVGWTFFPVTMTSPYEFSGIKPREVVVMVSLLYTMLWVGAFTGPILAGVVQEVSGDLRMALTVTSLAALTMTIGGAMLPRAWDLAPAQLRPESA